jgi:hypothetical protein
MSAPPSPFMSFAPTSSPTNFTSPPTITTLIAIVHQNSGGAPTDYVFLSGLLVISILFFVVICKKNRSAPVRSLKRRARSDNDPCVGLEVGEIDHSDEDEEEEEKLNDAQRRSRSD